jgi:hypothetical protein
LCRTLDIAHRQGDMVNAFELEHSLNFALREL